MKMVAQIASQKDGLTTYENRWLKGLNNLTERTTEIGGCVKHKKTRKA